MQPKRPEAAVHKYNEGAVKFYKVHRYCVLLILTL